jgi:cation transport regulator ChaB
MKYKTIKDLPFVWQLNLPEAAQHVYKDAFNRAWAVRRDEREARMRAWAEVRRRFARDPETGRWVAASQTQPQAPGSEVRAM